MKRFFDIVVSSIILLILCVPLLFLTWRVRSKLGSPVFFRQMRPGLYGMPFIMIKYRSMTEVSSSNNQLLPDVNRITDFGNFLRSNSLDELPELWNVIKGDMSLVGPRPLLMEYLPLYSKDQARRHEVKPGITGWAQVNGRNAITWDEKFKLDVWYVDHQSFWLDMKILALTVKKVLIKEGISAQGLETMPRFFGPGKEDK
jgi:lipopolysaccharide/colanic/teichoic acid biosynthesis glycosyltransferase